MSIHEKIELGVEEHRKRIFEYLDPNGTGSLADALLAARSIYLYTANIHDTHDFSFENTLYSFPKVSTAFGDFLCCENFHDIEFFHSDQFDTYRKDTNLVLEAQEFLRLYNQLVLRELKMKRVLS